MPPKGSGKGKKKAPTSVSPSALQNGLDLNVEANGIMSEESKTKTKDKPKKNVKANDELMEPVKITEFESNAPDEKNDTDEISEENSTKALEKRGKRPANKFSTKKEIDTKVYNYLDSLEKPPAKKPKGRPKRKGVNEAKIQENESISEDERDQEELVNTEKSTSTRGRKTAVKKVVEPKNQKAENVEKPEKEMAKGNRYEKLKSEDFENAKNVRVSLERSPDIDDMALKLQDSENAKVKAVAGTSGKGRGRKRVAEDPSSGSEPKKDKTEGSKRSQREKIPDVSALDFDNKSTNPQGKSWNLKIATWNVNGIRAWIEKDGLSYLHHENPDVLCLQETKCSEEKIPEECNPLGYHCYWLAGDKEGYSGVGLMSKEKPVSVEYGIRKKTHDNEGRVITAEYEKFYLVATYVPNAGRKLVRLDYRKQWDIDFKAYLKKLEKNKPIVLCGDLNVAHNEIDLANPKTNKKNAGFTQEERDGFSAILSEGFIDAFRHLYPDTKDAYTFWTYMMNARAKNTGWRLDYFVLSKILVDNLCDCVIRRDVMGSDHCPLVLFLHV